VSTPAAKLLRQSIAKSDAEELFWFQLHAYRIRDQFVREYRFHPERMWRFDFAAKQGKLAIEINGFGRHHTYSGSADDWQKMNAALRLGWCVLQYTAKQVKTGEAILEVIEWLNDRKARNVPDAPRT
jgi:very-short-patch-repair endonuclease